MYDTLNIPNKIVAGFNKRNDTYSGKLAYVVYYRNKAETKIVKEKSWNGWVDKSMGTEVYENVPTEGFVINKNAGGVGSGWGWNDRAMKFRVYDPRGFEIEITPRNLLYLLNECTSTKGKGLEGEFVYGWSGADLILVPVDSPEYKNSVENGKFKQRKVNHKDVKPGMSFTTKSKEEVIYMGRFHWLTVKEMRRPDFMKGRSRYSSNVFVPHIVETNKKHIFCKPWYDKDGNFKPTFIAENGFTSLATVNSEETVENFSEMMDLLANDKAYGEPIGIIDVPASPNLNGANKNAYYNPLNCKQVVALPREDGSYMTYSIEKLYDNNYDYWYRRHNAQSPQPVGYKIHPLHEVSYKNGPKVVATKLKTDNRVYSRTEMEAFTFKKLHLSLSNGKEKELYPKGRYW